MSALGAKLRKLGAGRVAFWCPGCRSMHQVNGFDHPDRQGPMWTFNGNGDAPTFSPSIAVRYNGPDAGIGQAPPAVCHSYVTEGRIQFLADSTHALAGQTVALPDFPIGAAT